MSQFITKIKENKEVFIDTPNKLHNLFNSTIDTLVKENNFTEEHSRNVIFEELMEKIPEGKIKVSTDEEGTLMTTYIINKKDFQDILKHIKV